MSLILNDAGVTSPGWGGFLGGEYLLSTTMVMLFLLLTFILRLSSIGVVAPLADALDGVEASFKLISDSFLVENPGLKYADVYKKGFVAVKATKVRNKS